MSYRENLEMCFKSGQMTAAEQHHARTGLIENATPVTQSPHLSDAELDKTIYLIDGVMNSYEPTETNIPPFAEEHLVKMRAILRKTMAGQVG